MTLGADRDEDQARRLLRERAGEGGARSPCAPEVLKELAQDRDGHHRLRGRNRGREREARWPRRPRTRTSRPGAWRRSSRRSRSTSGARSRRRAAASGEPAPTRDERSARRRRNAKRTRLQSPPRRSGWWRDASDEDAPRSKTKTKAAARRRRKPLDALLSLDPARLLGRRAAGRRAAARRVRRARRRGRRALEAPRGEEGHRLPGRRGGGMRRRGNGGGTRRKRKRALAFARGARAPAFPVRPRARPRLTSTRAGALVTEAVVRRVEKTLVQCAAHARAGDWDDARGESVVLARTLVAFAAASRRTASASRWWRCAREAAARGRAARSARAVFR